MIRENEILKRQLVNHKGEDHMKDLQKENEQLKKEYEQLKSEYRELKNKYALYRELAQTLMKGYISSIDYKIT